MIDGSLDFIIRYYKEGIRMSTTKYPKRRPCPHEWMIDVVRQCKAAGVKVYVKQVDMGKRVSHDPAEWPEELRARELP